MSNKITEASITAVATCAVIGRWAYQSRFVLAIFTIIVWALVLHFAAGAA